MLSSSLEVPIFIQMRSSEYLWSQLPQSGLWMSALQSLLTYHTHSLGKLQLWQKAALEVVTSKGPGATWKPSDLLSEEQVNESDDLRGGWHNWRSPVSQHCPCCWDLALKDSASDSTWCGNVVGSRNIGTGPVGPGLSVPVFCLLSDLQSLPRSAFAFNNHIFKRNEEIN